MGTISYFRLANYFRPMETDKLSHIFKPGSLFENAIQLYEFDNSLREPIFMAIARIEIAFRTKMMHIFSLTHGAFWFLDMQKAENEHLFLENITSVDRELHRSKEDFIKEHFKKYDKPSFPPIWKTLEVVSFGVLSKMYFNFSDTKAKKAVARNFGLPQHVILESWVVSITALRNCCAHHARIWNRSYPMPPAIPKALKQAWICNTEIPANKLYAQLSCLAYMLNAIRRNNIFSQKLAELVSSYPNVDITAMGFPSNWQEEPLWSN